MTHKEKALDYFERKFHCSQAVLAAFAPECGLTEEQALKLGACFGSGMRKGEVCGACTGALMVLGALYGQHDESDLESRMRANEVNVKMMERKYMILEDLPETDPNKELFDGYMYRRIIHTEEWIKKTKKEKQEELKKALAEGKTENLPNPEKTTENIYGSGNPIRYLLSEEKKK